MMSPRASSWTIKTLSSSALLLLLSSPIFAAYYGGGMRDHGHTRTGDGGVLTNLNVTGTVTASTVTAPAVNASTITAPAVNSSTITASSSTITNLTVSTLTVTSLGYVRAGRNVVAGNQSIPNSSATDVVFNVETVDLLGEYDNSTGIFTAREAGLYSVSACVTWQSSSVGVRTLTMVTSSADGGFAVSQTGFSVSGLTQMISTTLKMQKNGTVKISAFQTSGGALNLEYASTCFELNIGRVR